MAERLTVSGATTQKDIDRLMELSNENQSEYSPSCPIDYNLTTNCELSCFECWLAALKGADK